MKAFTVKNYSIWRMLKGIYREPILFGWRARKFRKLAKDLVLDYSDIFGDEDRHQEVGSYSENE